MEFYGHGANFWAKLFDLLHGILFCQSLGLHSIVMESDSKSLVDVVRVEATTP